MVNTAKRPGNAIHGLICFVSDVPCPHLALTFLTAYKLNCHQACNFLHGQDEPLINNRYPLSLNFTNLTGGKVHCLPDNVHAAFRDSPLQFNKLLRYLVSERRRNTLFNILPNCGSMVLMRPARSFARIAIMMPQFISGEVRAGHT